MFYAHNNLLHEMERKISMIYGNDYLLSTLQHDIVCRLIANATGASTVSIILYRGIEDDLQCVGRYINAFKTKAKTLKKSSTKQYLEMMKNIDLYEFIEANQRTPEQLNFSTYCNSIYSNFPSSNQEGFIAAFEGQNKRFAKDFEKYKTQIRTDNYSIDPNSSVTGLLYYYLTNGKKDDIPLTHYRICQESNILIVDLKKVPTRFKTCCQSLRKELGIVLDTNQKYIGVPLVVNQRIIGILRLLFLDNICIKNQSNETPEYTLNTYDLIECYINDVLNVTNIATLLSLHLNNKLYSEASKLISLKENLNEEFNYHLLADELARIVNCHGCILRLSDSTTKNAKIIEYSNSVDNYIKFIKRTNDPYITSDGSFLNELVNLFYPVEEDENSYLRKYHRIVSIIIDFNDEDFTITNQFFDNQLRLHSSHKWPGNKLKDYHKKIKTNFRKYRDLLYHFNISSVLIIPIKDKKYGFMTLANTRNRVFLNKDIALIIPVVRRVGTELRYRTEIDSVKLKKQKDFQHAIRIIFHQLTSPIGSMHNHLLNIKDGILSEQKLKLRLQEVLDTYTNFIEMLRSHQFFFDFLSSGKIPHKYESAHFFEFVKEIVRTYQQRALSEKGIEIKIYTYQEKHFPRSFRSDLKLLSHVLQALIDNAIKYSYNHIYVSNKPNDISRPKKDIPKEISISLQQNSNEFLIQIENWGCPIEPGEVEKILKFEKRGRYADQFNGIGSGIGLYLASIITESLHGNLKITPSNDHTTMTLKFKSFI